MTQLEFYFALSALWIAVAWMPYVLERFVSRGIAGTLANPSSNQARQAEWAERAKAAHRVGIETFTAFGPLAVYAAIKMPEDSYVGILAMSYFIGIFAHYIIYSLGIVVLRTVAFLLASLSTFALGLRVLGWI
ncbi:MAPEG family protein [Aestuariivita boseongensis]|uniref:MAPEG family protein n=1 Tax=Aestuariivita boseongensis TaxID=1470562 RepID=UPI000680DD1E|nr:MAPEG family protein [Aestuariivita boseongensis]